jgi:peptide-methionine (S)-S-oxide reductase
MEKALLGGGCFWCIEAVYNRVIGVQSAISGYAGGARKNPSYEQVCSGATGMLRWLRSRMTLSSYFV